eukprot:gene794-1042_t
MTIAAVASASRGLTEGLSREGRRILGGDAAFGLIHREATPQELAFLTGRGTVSTIATMRGMANAGDKGAALVEIKAVDAGYPGIGELVTEPKAPVADLLAARDGVFGAVADPVLFGRLDLKPGDTILGMSLAHGGHLTHGASVNFSGKLYKSVSYGLEPETELLDYAQVAELAAEHKPKMIVAGASAYSRVIDWQ